MKFGKVLKTTSENLFPEMGELFLRYKELKKQLKAIPVSKEAGKPESSGSGSGSANGSTERAGPTLLPEEQQFINTLNEDLARFNQYFMEKEEDSVIRLQTLSDEVREASSELEMQHLKAILVDFHGEMVLLLHWSLLNYAAVVKILKKHDKRTGVLLRAPYLANVLQQPFSSTTIMSRLVRRAEELVQQTITMSSEQHRANKEAALAGTAGRIAATEQEPPSSTVGGAQNLPTVSQQPTTGHWSAQEHGSSDPDGTKVPLSTRTQHALDTWATLSRTAITPSTVLPTEVDQPKPSDQQPEGDAGNKRKEQELPQEADVGQAAKRSKAGE